MRGACHLVRIRIYGIIGFSGFHQTRAFNRKAPTRIRLGVIFGYAKSVICAKRNPENPANPINPDSDKDAGLANRANPPKTKREPWATNPVYSRFPPVIPAKAGIHSWRTTQSPATKRE